MATTTTTTMQQQRFPSSGLGLDQMNAPLTHSWAVRMSSTPGQVHAQFYNLMTGKAQVLVNRALPQEAKAHWDLVGVSAQHVHDESLAKAFYGMPWLILERESVRLASPAESSDLPGGQQVVSDVGRFSSLSGEVCAAHSPPADMAPLQQIHSVDVAGVSTSTSSHYPTSMSATEESAPPLPPRRSITQPGTLTEASMVSRSISRRPVGGSVVRRPAPSTTTAATVQLQATVQSMPNNGVPPSPTVRAMPTGNVRQPLQPPPLQIQGRRVSTPQPQLAPPPPLQQRQVQNQQVHAQQVPVQQRAPPTPTQQAMPVRSPTQQVGCRTPTPNQQTQQARQVQTSRSPMQQQQQQPQVQASRPPLQQQQTSAPRVVQTAHASQPGRPVAQQAPPRPTPGPQTHVTNAIQSPQPQSPTQPAYQNTAIAPPPQQPVLPTKKEGRIRKMMKHPSAKIAVRLGTGLVVGGALGSEVGGLVDQWSSRNYNSGNSANSGGSGVGMASAGGLGLGALAGLMAGDDDGGDFGNGDGGEEYTTETTQTTYVETDYGALIDGNSTMTTTQEDIVVDQTYTEVDYGALIDGNSSIAQENVVVDSTYTTEIDYGNGSESVEYTTTTTTEVDYGYGNSAVATESTTTIAVDEQLTGSGGYEYVAQQDYTVYADESQASYISSDNYSTSGDQALTSSDQAAYITGDYTTLQAQGEANALDLISGSTDNSQADYITGGEQTLVSSGSNDQAAYITGDYTTLQAQGQANALDLISGSNDQAAYITGDYTTLEAQGQANALALI